MAVLRTSSKGGKSEGDVQNNIGTSGRILNMVHAGASKLTFLYLLGIRLLPLQLQGQMGPLTRLMSRMRGGHDLILFVPRKWKQA